MNQATRSSFIFISLLTWLMIHYGIWEGHIFPDATDHSTFLVYFTPTLTFIILWFGFFEHFKVFYCFRWPFIAFFIILMLVGILRPNAASSIHNTISILNGYFICMSLAAIAFSLPFQRAVDSLLFFIVLIFVPLTIWVHLTKIGPLTPFPDRVGNSSSLGGLFHSAQVSMVLGIGGLFSLYQFLAIRDTRRWRYLCVFGAMSLLILLTDCQSAWSGIAISYVLLVYTHLTTVKRLATLVGATLVVLPIIINNLSPSQFQRHDAESDFDFHQQGWFHTIQGIAERPLTGWGSPLYLQKNIEPLTLNNLIETHSATLALAFQSGIPATALFFWLFGSMAILYIRHSLDRRKPMLSVVVFWLFVPFFWGLIYNGTAGFIQVFFSLTYFVGLLHPELYSGSRWPRFHSGIEHKYT